MKPNRTTHLPSSLLNLLSPGVPRPLYKGIVSNTNKEALLPLLRLNPRTLKNRVRTGDTNAFRGSRRLEVEDRRFAKLCARGLERVADGEEDAAAHEERGFAWDNVSKELCIRRRERGEEKG